MKDRPDILVVDDDPNISRLEQKQELQKLRSELCIKYHNTGDSESKKLVKAISLVLDNCH